MNTGQKSTASTPAKTPHQRAIDALIDGDARIERKGFVAAVEKMCPGRQDAADIAREMRPDAYLIDIAAMDVTIYEVVHTSPVTRRKAESIFELDGELSDLGWRLTLSVVDVCGKEMCRVDPWALNWQVFGPFMVGKSKDVIPAALAAMQDDAPIRIKARDLPQRPAALAMLI